MLRYGVVILFERIRGNPQSICIGVRKPWGREKMHRRACANGLVLGRRYKSTADLFDTWKAHPFIERAWQRGKVGVSGREGGLRQM